MVADFFTIMYAAPVITFAILLWLAPLTTSSVNGGSPTADQQTIANWLSLGPILGVSLGLAIFAAIGNHWFAHGEMTWHFTTPQEKGESLAWVTLLIMWISNIKLEIWTNEPLRKMLRSTGSDDLVGNEQKFQQAVRALSVHLKLQATLVMAVIILFNW